MDMNDGFLWDRRSKAHARTPGGRLAPAGMPIAVMKLHALFPDAMDISNTTALAPDTSALQLLQADVDRLDALVQQYMCLDPSEASPSDLGARVSRIGGRMQAILQFETELMLPRLTDAALRRCAQAQSEDMLQHVQRLAELTANDHVASAQEMQALADHFRAHAQLLTQRVWPALQAQDQLPLGSEWAQWRAHRLQDEAAD